jgi:aryl-alcohol dehydrogenase-like predicted oxidoreductase
VEQRPLGRTGLSVSALGFGAGHIGEPRLSEQDVARLLGAALDAGITLFDTARSYGLSEERLGRHLGARRAEVVLSTKCGYGIEGIQDWTGPCVTAGIDAALRLLRTDRIDIMHLHSCPPPVLQRDDIREALARAVRQGKIQVAAYSGDNEPLERAIRSGAFGSVQASINLCDQRALAYTLPEAQRRGVGFIAKRPLANAPWRFQERPAAQDIAEYWDRLRAMALDPMGMGWDELALRFSAFTPGVSSCIVGTSRPEHLLACVRILDKGPLPVEVLDRVRGAFLTRGALWPGQV